MPTTADVSGKANIYGAGAVRPPAPGGGGGGVSPVPVSLASLGNPAKVVFPAVSGTVSGWAKAGGYNGPDGGHNWGGLTDTPAWNGISGIRNDNATMFLVGVFLGPTGQPAHPPPRLNVTAANSAVLSAPVLGQQFFIGDGRTVSRDLQTVVVPAGAATLYLGFAEVWGFRDAWRLPGFYDDNGGSLRVDVRAAPALALPAVTWVPLDERETGHKGQAAVRVAWKTTNYNGPVRLTAFQSATAKPDPALKVASLDLKDTAAGGGEAVMYFAARPPAGKTTEYIQVTAEATGTTTGLGKPAGVMKALQVLDSGAVSYELQADAPVAQTREARVRLWLEQYADKIKGEAKLRGIAPEGIAGVIAWEALVNAKPSGPHGPGKVHATEWGGASVAQEVEGLGKLPKQTNPEREKLLGTPEGAIRYIAAILGTYADAATKAGVKVDLHDKAHSEILATLYQGVTIEKKLIPDAPTYGLWDPRDPVKSLYYSPVRLGNAPYYFAYKVRTKAAFAPNAQMGTWVHNNLSYLTRALG